MKFSEREKLAHDLRAPLARAKTMAKLLRESGESAEREEYSSLLEEALAELESRLRALEENSDA